MERGLNVSVKMSFWRKNTAAEEDLQEDDSAHAQVALSAVNAKRDKAKEKMKLSEGMHSWVMCPFRSLT